MDTFDLRQLNRATLARQCLLERVDGDVVDVVGRVGGLQAQAPAPPAIGLHARMAGFDLADYVAAVLDHRLVRGTTLRGTLHLHAADDYRTLRASMQPALDAFIRGMAGRRVRGEDVAPALELGRTLLDERPRLVRELRELLTESFPESSPQGLANIPRMGMPLLVVPDATQRYGFRSVAPFRPAEQVVGDSIVAGARPRHVVRRFLEVLGPGSPADAQTWSGLRGLKPVMRAMEQSGELVVLTTFEGDELYDLPDAPRPPGDTPAGVRFLPMWDNLLLSHKDRSRVIDPKHKPYLASKNGMPPPTYLVDGFVHGTWSVVRSGVSAMLLLSPFAPVPSTAEQPLLSEGDALLRLVEPDADERNVQLG